MSVNKPVQLGLCCMNTSLKNVNHLYMLVDA